MTTLSALMDLRGRRALVTGAAGGIGRVISETLVELGADLVLVDRPGANYALPLGEGAFGSTGTVEYLECDLEVEEDRKRLMESVNSGSRLDILVNNAAFVGTSDLQGWSTSFNLQTVETWRRALEVNLTAVFDLSKGLHPLLALHKEGSIINVASIYGMYGPDYALYMNTGMGNPAAYAASKGGLLQLTRWLSTTLAPDVRVNALSPGGVQRNQPPAFVQRYADRTPMRRMATEDDFRGSIAYLASGMSRYVTGQNLAVDGGWGVW